MKRQNYFKTILDIGECSGIKGPGIRKGVAFVAVTGKEESLG